jgi:Rhodopirellula transposase DDE domain
MGCPDETRARFDLLRPHLRGRFRRLWAAAEALSLGRGGRTQVASITGICVQTITRGIRELQAAEPPIPALTRESGARPVGVIGRPSIERKNPAIVPALERMLADEVAGDPMGDQRWVRSSVRKLRVQLAAEGHPVAFSTIALLLRRMGYSLRVNHKKRTGSHYPDRDQQFRHIAAQKHAFLSAGLPVISVDTKKKEFIGEFKNNGRVWCREATEVNQYDFSTGAECLAVPYGVYDLGRNRGFVVVGVSHNTAEFAVSSIARWWEQRGRIDHPRAGELLMLADGGGGNGNRSRAWKLNLQRMVSDRYGLKLAVCHYPPGCSKWNPVEYRLFSQISINWAGKPLKSLPLMLGYIRGTTTTTGLQVEAVLDEETYRKGQKVTREELNQLRLQAHPDRPTLNYTISPHT